MSGILPRIENKYTILRNDIQQIRDTVVALINSLYVAKSGDTMTGKLVINDGINTSSSQLDLNVSGLLDTNEKTVVFVDGATLVGKIGLYRRTLAPTGYDFFIGSLWSGGVTSAKLLYVQNDGKVGIGTTSPTSPLQVVGIPAYANDAAAGVGGLTAGAIYQVTGTGALMVKQ